MTGEVFVFPTSFAQQRLWFLDQMTPGLTAYNVLSAVALSDSVDRLVLQRTLDEIARRHEALRTTFDLVDGRPVQSVGPARPIPLAFVDLTRVGADQREEGYRRLAAAEAERPFDLQRGPLIRGTVAAAPPLRTQARVAAGLVEGHPRRGPRRSELARRPGASGGSQLPRGEPAVPDSGVRHGRAQAAVSAVPGHPVHGGAGGVRGAAASLHGTG